MSRAIRSDRFSTLFCECSGGGRGTSAKHCATVTISFDTLHALGFHPIPIPLPTDVVGIVFVCLFYLP
jgi:hypothetical protein